MSDSSTLKDFLMIPLAFSTSVAVNTVWFSDPMFVGCSS